MGRGVSGKGSWCEIAPPQMISVERCSPRQKTMETILERMAALGAMVETAPPRIILVERSLSRKRGSLDTIAEESISMAVDLANGAAAAVRPLSSRRMENPSGRGSHVDRIAPGKQYPEEKRGSLMRDGEEMSGLLLLILLNWPDFHAYARIHFKLLQCSMVRTRRVQGITCNGLGCLTSIREILTLFFVTDWSADQVTSKCLPDISVDAQLSLVDISD